MKIVIIDNYDSFTYNLYQYIGEITKTIPDVFYNDQIPFTKLKADAIIISPGPGIPTKKRDFGISTEVIQKSECPILGICLGHQGIGSIFGAKVVQAPEIMHGRISKIYHNNNDLFTHIPQGFTAVRYHSLVLKNLPHNLQKTAWTADGVIMGLKHVSRPLWGVQFHPESIGTQYGKEILKNFITFVKNGTFL